MENNKEEQLANDYSTLDIDIREYDSPLDLLDYLLQRANVPLDRVSIASISDQYIEVIKDLPDYDMDLVSSFLLLASTLIQIKSTLLLPQIPGDEDTEFIDPSDELIFRLLRYRRCRLVAKQLKLRHEKYTLCHFKQAETPRRLGIEIDYPRQPLSFDKFMEAVEAIAARNEARFQATKESMRQIVKREQVSVQVCMKKIEEALDDKSRFFFYELFPPDQSIERRVAGFLAVLELLRANKIKASQKSIFTPIYIEAKEQ